MKVLSAAAALVMLASGALFAQEGEGRQGDRTPTGPTRGSLLQVQQMLDRSEGQMNTHTAALRRDAFIVTRLVAAVGALNDFQVNSAIQQALDEVVAAQVRAGQNPKASAATVEMLATVHELLVKARSQGSMADLPALQRDILTRLEPLQRAMFAQVDELRRSRLIISDIRTRLMRWDDAIDQSMVEALSASLDYIKKGGK